MALQIQPVIGEWFRTVDGTVFEVVAVDDNDGGIEIQYADGDVEELDMDTWRELVMGPAEPAEDWAAGFDDEDSGNYSDLDIASRTEDW